MINVKGNLEVGKIFLHRRMVLVNYGAGRSAFLHGLDGDGRAMFIAATDKNHIPFLCSQVADIDIRRNIGPGQMAYVFQSIGIGQGRGDQVSLGVIHEAAKIRKSPIFTLSMALISDAEILKQLKEGHPAAFKLLFDTYYQPLCLQASLILHDSMAAEDMVQQVFMRFWEQRKFEEIESSLLGYLRTMVRNSCFTQLKNSQRSRTHLEKYGHLVPEVTDRELLEMKELAARMQKAIDELPEQCRHVFIQACVEGMKYKEVAEKEHISINTVKEHLRRAFRKMREKLKDTRLLV